jgi:8-oxo-dGTP diphosphatase
MQPILRVAAKACIVNDEGKVLIVREAATGKDVTNAGKWGLPGGRLEPGESFFDGLKREVAEETGIEVEPIKPLYVGEWRPVIRDVPHHIIAVFMLCKAKTTAIKTSDEHDEFTWIAPEQLPSYPMMAPDDKVVEAYASDAAKR